MFKKNIQLLLYSWPLLFLAQNVWAKEELVIIQAVSQERKTFVVNRGMGNGHYVGQESIFSNNNVSVVARAIETTHNYTLWEVKDKRAVIPFDRGDVINYNSHSYESVAFDFKQIGFDYEPKTISEFRKKNSWIVKSAFSRGMYESTTSIDKSQTPTRQGIQLETGFNYRFRPEFEVSLTGRYDYEISRIENPDLDIQTKRMAGILYGTYHFENLGQTQSNIYLSLGAGIGYGSTTISEETSNGLSYVIPTVILGYHMPIAKTKALVVETCVENLSSKEEFDDGTRQDTNVVNAKISLGLRF